MSEPVHATADGRGLFQTCSADPVFAARYDLSTWHELGAGGCAVVARLTNRTLQSTVAVKVFTRTTALDRKRLAREVQNAYKMLRASDAVVHVHAALDGLPPAGAGEAQAEDGLWWIEMEHVDGRDLGDWLHDHAGQPLPFAPGPEALPHTREVLEIASAAAGALAAAEATEVVHRDVKPENFLVPRQPPPHVKLADFGMSKDRVRPASDTVGWTGTDLYRAPEMWDCDPATSAADVYSFGLVLFRLFTNNRFPWDVSEEPDPTFAHRLHTRERPDRLRDHNPHAPRELETLVARCLAKRPEQRPEAAEVAAEIRRLRDLHRAEPALVHPARAQRRPSAGVAVLILVAALAGGGWALAPRIQLGKGAAPAATPTTVPAAREPAPSRLGTAVPSSSSPGHLAVLATARTATPRRPEPPAPTAHPAASAMPSPQDAEAETTVTLQPGGGLALASTKPLTQVVVTLVRGEARHSCRAGTVDPGRALLLTRDEFEPEPPADFAPALVEVAGEGPDGPLRRSFAQPRPRG